MDPPRHPHRRPRQRRYALSPDVCRHYGAPKLSDCYLSSETLTGRRPESAWRAGSNCSSRVRPFSWPAEQPRAATDPDGRPPRQPRRRFARSRWFLRSDTGDRRGLLLPNLHSASWPLAGRPRPRDRMRRTPQRSTAPVAMRPGGSDVRHAARRGAAPASFREQQRHRPLTGPLGLSLVRASRSLKEPLEVTELARDR
jgi:hypothetical protein